MNSFIKKFAILLLIATLIPFKALAVIQSDSLKLEVAHADSLYHAGSYSDACKKYKSIVKLKDSISKITYEKEVKAIKNTYQIDQLYKENKIEENKIMTRFILFISILVVLISVVFIYLKKKNKEFREQKAIYDQEKLKHEESLKVKNHQFSTMNKEIDDLLYSINRSEEKKDVSGYIKSLKKYLLLFIFIFFSATISAEITPKQRDSLFSVAENMPQEKRLIFLEQIQREYFRTPLGRDFIKRFYEEAVRCQDHEREIKAMSNLFNLAAVNKMDIDSAKFYLNKVREISFKYQIYDYYFSVFSSYLGMEASKGELELVIKESAKMKREADSLNNTSGKVSANISLAYAYFFARENQKVIDILTETINIENINDEDKRKIYMRLSNCFFNLNKTEESIIYLQKEEEIIENIIKKTPAEKSKHKGNLLSLYLRYAEAYTTLNNPTLSHHYLLKAKQYYTDNCFISNFIMYHSFWGHYYAKNNNWESALMEMEIALNRIGNIMPVQKTYLLNRKNLYLSNAGRNKEAAEGYRYLIHYSDSLNADFISKQEKVIQENYRWEEGVLTKIKNTHRNNIITIIFVSLLLLTILFFAIRIYLIFIRLRDAKDKALAAASLAEESDKLKGVFQENITREISAPLAQMSSLLEKDSLDKVKETSSNLIDIVDKTLDLSYLELGKMEFNTREHNIVSLCFDVIKLTKEQNDNRVEIKFNSNVDYQMVKIDRDKFLEFMLSIFTLPKGYALSETIEADLSYAESGEKVILSILGSPLSNPQFESSNQSLYNRINELFFASFGGKYEVKMSKLHPVLIIKI